MVQNQVNDVVRTKSKNPIFTKTISTQYGEMYKISFAIEDVQQFLQQSAKNGKRYLNLVMKTSKGGQKYTTIDDWKPKGQQPTQATLEMNETPEGFGDIPF